MKYDIRQNPTACAAREGTRYQVRGAAVVRIAKRDADCACSTNGRTLLAVPVEIEPGDETGKVYPAAAFADAAKLAKAQRAADVSGFSPGILAYGPQGEVACYVYNAMSHVVERRHS